MNTTPSDFAIRVDSPRDGPIRIFVRGELDIATSPELRHVLDEQLSVGREVLLDLSGVQFMDSSGLKTVIEASQDKRGTLIVVEELSHQVRRLLEISGAKGLLRPALDGLFG